MDSKLTVIIVNYKSWNYLSKCLDSLIEQDSGTPNIVIVDNFSNDGKIQEFESQYKSVKWIKLSYNSGFSTACNIGAKHAKSPWLLFLNPDSIVPKDCFKKLIPFCERNKELKIISIRSKNAYLNKSFSHGFYFNFWTVTNFIRQFYILLNKSNREIKKIDGKKVIMIGWVSGSFLLIRKKDFKSIGGWDEDFWMYAEDMDICKRAYEKGMIPCVIYDWDYYHMHGGSSRKNKKIKLITKSELICSKHIFIDKHVKGIEKKLSHFLLIFVTTFGLIFLFPFSSFHRSLLLRLIKYWIESLKSNSWKSLYRQKK